MKTIPGMALALALALQATAAGAADGRPVDERRPLKADARVSVSNVAGLIEVEAWDRNELHLTGTLSDEVEQLEISGSDARLKIAVRVREKSRNVGDTTLRLKVPAGVTLSAEAVSADIRVRGLRGDLDLDSVSGDVGVDAQSRKVEASSVSGDVALRGPAEDTRVESVSGNVTVLGARGELRSESVSGDLRVEARAIRRLKAESVSGDVLVDLELAQGAEVSVESLSGDVQLVLPQMPEGELEMETFSGELESAWPPSPGASRDYRYAGKGPGRVKLSSFSGDITLKKREISGGSAARP